MVTTLANAGNLTPEEKARDTKIGADAARSLVGAGSAALQTGKDGAKVVTDTGAAVVKDVKEKGFFGSIGDFFGKMWDGVKEFAGFTGDPEKDKKGLNIGSLLGGFLGAGGAWAVSQFFGGGILGTIAMIGLIPLGVILGVQFGDKTINPLIGRPSRGTTPAQTQAVTQASPAPQQTLNQNVTAGLGPNSGEMYQQFRTDIRNQYPNLTSSDVVGIGSIVQPYVPGRTSATAQVQPGQPIGWRIGG